MNCLTASARAVDRPMAPPGHLTHIDDPLGQPPLPSQSRPHFEFTWPSKRTAMPGCAWSTLRICASRGCDLGSGIARLPTNWIICENHMRRAPGSTMTPAPSSAHRRQMAKSPRA